MSVFMMLVIIFKTSILFCFQLVLFINNFICIDIRFIFASYSTIYCCIAKAGSNTIIILWIVVNINYLINLTRNFNIVIDSCCVKLCNIIAGTVFIWIRNNVTHSVFIRVHNIIIFSYLCNIIKYIY